MRASPGCIAPGRRSVGRVLAVATTVILVAWTVAAIAELSSSAQTLEPPGYDFVVDRAIARQFLDTGRLYDPVQLAGPYGRTTILTPYTSVGVVNLYPPPAVLLFLPFLVLPAILWWLIPIGVLVVVIVSWRPAWWSLPFIALPFAVLPPCWAAVVFGNTSMWVVAVAALATRWPWPAPLLFLKPSVGWVALVFARRRPWWLGAGVLLAVSVAFLPWWGEYLTATRNLVGGLGLRDSLAYSLAIWPAMLAPVVARLASTRPSPAPATATKRWVSAWARPTASG